MYGPINPLTKAIGRIAAITAKVAKIVGLPTSLTVQGNVYRRAPAILGQAIVARHVLDHHDVIHQNADREDQGEERDPVEV